jgi:hypothetical protein
MNCRPVACATRRRRSEFEGFCPLLATGAARYLSAYSSSLRHVETAHGFLSRNYLLDGFLGFDDDFRLLVSAGFSYRGRAESYQRYHHFSESL